MMLELTLRYQEKLMVEAKDICIYTSYFGNARKILKTFPDACLVSIAGKTPDWLVCAKYKKLAPHYSWWKEWHDKNLSEQWYIDKYYETVLNVLNPITVKQELQTIGKDVILLCFETPEKFCHRHLVAKWLNEKTGLAVQEYILQSQQTQMQL